VLCCVVLYCIVLSCGVVCCGVNQIDQIPEANHGKKTHIAYCIKTKICC